MREIYLLLMIIILLNEHQLSLCEHARMAAI